MDNSAAAEIRDHMVTVTRQLDVILANLNGKAARHTADLETVRAEVAELRAYVEKIETEAHEAMEGMMSPEKMMEMAGKFMSMGT